MIKKILLYCRFLVYIAMFCLAFLCAMEMYPEYHVDDRVLFEDGTVGVVVPSGGGGADCYNVRLPDGTLVEHVPAHELRKAK